MSEFVWPQPVTIALALAVGGPLAASVVLGVRMLLLAERPSERTVTALIGGGLLLSLAGAALAIAAWAGWLGAPVRGTVEFGAWLRIGTYEIPAVAQVDGLAVALAGLGAWLTALVARFSRTYLHKEPGFVRFFLLLGLFATGVQLVAFAGALGALVLVRQRDFHRRPPRPTTPDGA